MGLDPAQMANRAKQQTLNPGALRAGQVTGQAFEERINALVQIKPPHEQANGHRPGFGGPGTRFRKCHAPRSVPPLKLPSANPPAQQEAGDH